MKDRRLSPFDSEKNFHMLRIGLTTSEPWMKALLTADRVYWAKLNIKYTGLIAPTKYIFCRAFYRHKSFFDL